MRFIVSSLLLTIFLIQLPRSFTQQTCPASQFLDTTSNTCVETCPTATYVGTQDTQAACLPQIPIRAWIRPTPEQRVFIVLFNNTPVPFNTVEEFENQVKVSLEVFDYSQNITVSAEFLTESRDIVQVHVNAQEVPRETSMFFIFPDFKTVNSSQSYVTASKVLIPLPYSELSDDDQDSINALTKLDRGLEYAWIAITCLNPYAYLYMNTKLYRETLEMFKRINVQYDSYATKFFLQNNNKVSGFKAPNMFPILIEDDPVTSGWNRGEDNRLTINGIDHDRIQDLRVNAADTVLKYDPFPLFLDNYGIQITIFLLIIVLIIVFELSNIVFCCRRRQEASKLRRVFEAIRTYLRWNLLIASIIGSFQSLTFYFMVQMQAWSKQGDHNSHDKLNFWFAIGTIIVLGVFFPAWIIPKLFIIYKERKVDKNLCYYHEYYGIFVKIFNLERRKSLTFLFVMMVRTAVFAALTLFLKRNPVAQTSVMVAFSILFMVYLVILRPFMRVFHFIYQIINEIVLIFYLTTLLYLAQEDDNGFVDSSEGDTTGKILIALWLFVPFVAIVFGMADIIMHLVRRPKSPKTSQKYFEPIVVVDPFEERVVESGKKIMEGGDHQQEKELSLTTKNPDLQTEGTIELATINPVSGEIEKEAGYKENPRSEEEEVRGAPFLFNSGHQSRRSPPSLPLADRIGTIVEEDAEKEQVSAKYIKPEERMSEEEQVFAQYPKKEDSQREQISAMKQEKPRQSESATKFYRQPESATKYSRQPESATKFQRQPESTTRFPIQPESATKFSRQSDSATKYPRQPESATKFQRQPESATKFSRQPESATKFPIQPESAAKFQRQPESATKFSRQPESATKFQRQLESVTNLPKKAESTTNFQPFQLYSSQPRMAESISPVRYNTRNSYRATVSKDNDVEERETLRAPRVVSPFRDNDNQSQDGGSQTSVVRTQDRVKAMPMSLDLAMPTTTTFSKTQSPPVRFSVPASQTEFDTRRASHRVQQTAFPSLDDFMQSGKVNRNYHSVERKSVPASRYMDEEAPRRSFRKKPIFEY